MKNNLLIIILFLFITTISSSLFAQAPPDPGIDPLNNQNPTMTVLQDSIRYKKSDSSKVANFQNFSENNLMQTYSAKSEIYTVYCEEMNKKYFHFDSLKLFFEKFNLYSFSNKKYLKSSI
jgi:hypothetical protein